LLHNYKQLASDQPAKTEGVKSKERDRRISICEVSTFRWL